MGKGDKKSRRGKIILGTYGVRRHRKTAARPAIRESVAVVEKEVRDKKAPKERKPAHDVKETIEPRAKTDVAEVDQPVTASAGDTPEVREEKQVRPKKETKAAVPKEKKEPKSTKEPQPKKEK